MVGEQVGALGGNKISEDPSVLHTRINNFWEDPQLHARLVAKSAEYAKREEEFHYTAPDYRRLQQGPGMFRAIFKDSILRFLLELAEDGTRNFEANPILMPEVALAISEQTGINVTRAATFPFIYDEGSSKHTPDFHRLSTEATEEEYMFQDAYAIIQQYSKGSVSGLDGGTGLPEVSERA